MTLKEVGVVRSAITERKQMPSLGAPACIVIHPEYAGGLLRFEKHSHVWVMAWLDRGERDLLQVTPRGGSELHGVFAVRSPARPNPIGLTAARVARFEGREIEVDRLDFLDGTPVIDIKPYFVTRDAIYAANNAPIGNPTSPEAWRESLVLQAAGFHGERCAEVFIAVDIVERFHEQYGRTEGWMVTAPLQRPHLVDALMGITRVTPGKGTLLFHNHSSVVLTRGEEQFRYEL
jgi:tRNA-Thr(GGU) m(6)t(6)A37 methyltransferase TsaA